MAAVSRGIELSSDEDSLEDVSDEGEGFTRCVPDRLRTDSKNDAWCTYMMYDTNG